MAWPARSSLGMLGERASVSQPPSVRQFLSGGTSAGTGLTCSSGVCGIAHSPNLHAESAMPAAWLASFVCVYVALHFCSPSQVMKHVGYSLEEGSSGPRVDWDHPITTEEIEKVESVNLSLSRQALRVLAFTIRPLSDADIETLKNRDGADQRLRFALGEETEVS